MGAGFGEGSGGENMGGAILGAVCTQKERAPQLCGAGSNTELRGQTNQTLRRRIVNAPSNPIAMRPIVVGSGTETTTY